jgi:16S rRNA (guanine966-N2)-methyltransferase
MRVIAGSYKGRRLVAPSWPGIRPTSDKLRETLFNILAPRLAGARILDGYAGTGAIGIEALSRGAAHVTFIERDRRAAALIRRNLDICRVRKADYTIEAGDFVATARRLADRSQFDIVVLDPPYDTADLDEPVVAGARLLAPAGVLVLERATRRGAEDLVELERTRDVTSGDSTLTFYRHR